MLYTTKTTTTKKKLDLYILERVLIIGKTHRDRMYVQIHFRCIITAALACESMLQNRIVKPQ